MNETPGRHKGTNGGSVNSSSKCTTKDLVAGTIGECGSRAIVMACDEAYATPLATAVRSMSEANRSGRPLHIVVLTAEFSDSMKRKVEASVLKTQASFHWVNIDLSDFEECSTLPYISRVTYARLLLPYLFAKSVEKVLYLDADILVLEDLEPLWQTNLEGAVVGAVVDIDSDVHAGRLDLASKRSTSKSQDFTAPSSYFNAGVLLVDLPRWRQESISERAMHYLGRHPNTPLSDQDALNVACAGLWKKLDRLWNFHYGDAVYCPPSAEPSPSIIHFVGKWKPWKAAALSRNSRVYDAFRSRTQFARTNREKARDAIHRSWASLKRLFKQYEIVSVVYGYVTHRIRPRRA